MTCSLTHPQHGLHLVVIINTKDRDAESIMGTIVHECTHLSWYVMEGVGIEVSPDNHEIQCYIMEEMVREVYRVVNCKECLEKNKINIGDL